jgi:hypothetical protein
MDTEKAYRRIKEDRAKKGLFPAQVTKPEISGEAAKDLVATFKLREKTQAKACNSSSSKVIR